MKIIVKIAIVCCLLISSSPVFARPSYTGYSSAPGCMGRCASSCHGSSGGTIQISGFPSEYTPGETYTIAISHSGGSSIRQFNGSCRIGTGSENAGTITAGTNTVTYNRSEETNGIHLSSTNQNNASFSWTAPSEGTGEVRLYISGLQGSYSGQNSTLSLISNEAMTDVEEGMPDIPAGFALEDNYPNPFNASTTIRYTLPEPSEVLIEIYDVLGRKVATLAQGKQPAGDHQVTWNANDRSSGLFFYSVQAGDFKQTRRMLLLK